MASDTTPAPTYEQELTDVAIAHAELRTARINQHRIVERAMAANPTGYRGDVSVYLARLQVQSAEIILNNLIEYYRNLHEQGAIDDPAPASTAVANAPPTQTGLVIEIEDSDDEDDPAPAYSSWPSTPTHFYAALAEDPNLQAPAAAAPSTPPRQTDGGALSQALLSPPPSTQPRQAFSQDPLSPPPSTQPRCGQAPEATPSTPRRAPPPTATIVGEGGYLTSPTPSRKHYIVTRGRRTGIYNNWPEAHAYTDGLGSSGAWQGFTTYREAFDAYMRARERGLLRIVRLPEDTDEEYGKADEAEDLL